MYIPPNVLSSCCLPSAQSANITDTLLNGDKNMTDKTLPDLKKFVDSVNKKDKLNGKKVTYNFVKRKRK
jgi:hypothetical protein